MLSNPKMVRLFILGLLEGKEQKLSRHIPRVSQILVFTRNFVTQKENDDGKVHHSKRYQMRAP